MFTVSQVARRCGLSRSTLLYYDSIGLLKPAARGQTRYRQYSEKDLHRLRQICVYRNMGVALEDIARILDGPDTELRSALQHRLQEANEEIERLRAHQHAILKLLRNPDVSARAGLVTKEAWTSLLSSSGFTADDMHGFHAEFERSAPDEHQRFLEFLSIPAEEIRHIRESSRAKHLH